MSPSAPATTPPAARRDLSRTALWLGILLELLAILKQLPAGAFVFLGLVVLALLALLFWNPVVTVLVAAAVVALVVSRRRAR